MIYRVHTSIFMNAYFHQRLDIPLNTLNRRSGKIFKVFIGKSVENAEKCVSLGYSMNERYFI